MAQQGHRAPTPAGIALKLSSHGLPPFTICILDIETRPLSWKGNSLWGGLVRPVPFTSSTCMIRTVLTDSLQSFGAFARKRRAMTVTIWRETTLAFSMGCKNMRSSCSDAVMQCGHTMPPCLDLLFKGANGAPIPTALRGAPHVPTRGGGQFRAQLCGTFESN